MSLVSLPVAAWPMYRPIPPTSWAKNSSDMAGALVCPPAEEVVELVVVVDVGVEVEVELLVEVVVEV